MLTWGGRTWIKLLRIHVSYKMREKNSKKIWEEGRFKEDFIFADQPTRFFDRHATRNKLFPKVALSHIVVKDLHLI